MQGKRRGASRARRFRTWWLFAIPFVTSLVAAASKVLAQAAPGDAVDVAAPPIHYVLSWQGILSTVVYGAIGMVFAFLGYKIYDLIVPFSLTKELEEDQNVAVGIVVGAVIVGVSIIMAAAIAG